MFVVKSIDFCRLAITNIAWCDFPCSIPDKFLPLFLNGKRDDSWSLCKNFDTRWYMNYFVAGIPIAKLKKKKKKRRGLRDLRVEFNSKNSKHNSGNGFCSFKRCSFKIIVLRLNKTSKLKSLMCLPFVLYLTAAHRLLYSYSWHNIGTLLGQSVHGKSDERIYTDVHIYGDYRVRTEIINMPLCGYRLLQDLGFCRTVSPYTDAVETSENVKGIYCW